MQKVEPNSIEAVVLFILYICLQDGKISDKEFAMALQYLIKKGIIVVNLPTV